MKCKILTYRNINRAEWGTLVRESRTGTWFQSPEAYDFFASQEGVMLPFAVGITELRGMGYGEQRTEEDSQETLRGVCVGYVTVEKNPLKQFFTRRAIILGGPCLADDATEEEAEALMSAVKENASLLLSHKDREAMLPSPFPLRDRGRLLNPIYIETRNFNDYSQWRTAFEKAGFTYQPHLNFHIDCTDRDAMQERLSDNRKRQIKKSIQSGTITEEAQNEQEVAEWYAILADLYRRKVKTPLFPLSFFIAFYRQRRGVYLLVKHKDKVTGGVMCPIAEGKCLYEWFICGLDTAYKGQYPSVSATWGAMEYAYAHHLPRFDIMGAGVPGVPYGVRDFKERFGGQLVEHGRWLYIHKPFLYKIGVVAVRLIKRM